MDRVHNIGELSFENDHLRVEIDGKQHVFDLADISSRLLHASSEQRTTYELSASGYGIHWPLIDEDLSIDGLLGVKHLQPRRAAKSSGRNSTRR